MATFAIESNGRIEKTAVYFNGEQIGGIKEIFINLDEDGTFDAVIQYEGTDKQLHSKSIFLDTLDHLKIVEPAFTEDEAKMLHLIEVDSDGDIENTMLYLNGEALEGVVNILIHIKAAPSKDGIGNLFGIKKKVTETVDFKANITYRNEDDSIETENIF